MKRSRLRSVAWCGALVLAAAAGGPCSAAAVRSDPARYWKGGVVPCVIDPSIAHPDAILKAMRAWEAAGIRFPKRTREADYVVFTLDARAKHRPQRPDEDEAAMAGAVSAVGRIGGRQEIVAAGDDVPWWRWAHEIGHTLGLFHEHLRNDRDRWVTIHWENIAPPARHNFEIKRGKTFDLGSFDAESIMLYTWNQNAVDRTRPTITLNARPAFHDFGAMVVQKLSAGDVAAVRRLYFEGGIHELRRR